MKTVILAGGFGTRISEETGVRPKPMVEIGGMPILWHIMKMYSADGFNDFIICCGFKGHIIKDFFANYSIFRNDLTFNMKDNSFEVLNKRVEPWNVTLIDTGLDVMTGGRIKRIQEYVGNETFFLTYGDGVCDVNFHALYDFHKQQGAYATLTAVQIPGRFGVFNMEPDTLKINAFREKPKSDHDSAWVNGGFFVLEPEIFDYIENDTTVWEREPLENLAREGQLAGYQHDGFWQSMDTLRDKHVLEEIWASSNPPWRKW